MIYSFLGKNENRKGAVKPRPLCTPLGLFLGVLGLWGCDTVLTFVCMLRCWMWNVVPRLLQWNCNEVLDVRCTSAEFRSLYYAAIYPTEISKVPLGYISAQCWIASTEAYRHKLISFSIPQSLHYIKKGPGVCRGARPCAPLRFSHIPMWIYPLRASAVHVAYSNISYRNIQSSVEIYFGSVLNC